MASRIANFWTLPVTVDGKLSSHWEHTILVSEFGPEVLTRGAQGATG